MRFVVIIFFLLLFPNFLQAQVNFSGTVYDSKTQLPLPNAIITSEDKILGISNENGAFNISLTSDSTYFIYVRHQGYHSFFTSVRCSPFAQNLRNFYLEKNNGKDIDEIVIKDKSLRYQHMEKLEIRNIKNIASANDATIAMIKTLPGVVSNNELSSQYSVRGGSFDENLIFINDFEVYKPQLIQSSQQEGNPVFNSNLIQSIQFSSGGFQSRYGDKMSSVLSIQYKRPNHFAGSILTSFLNNGFHVEGTSKNKNFKYVLGARQRTSRNLLQSQETKGQYLPSAKDIQTFITYDVNTDLSIEAFGYYSQNRFYFVPEERFTKFGVFSDVKGFLVNYDTDSKEDDRFNVNMAGVSATYHPTEHTTYKWLASWYGANEKEQFNIIGVYKLGEVETDLSKDNAGDLKNLTGYGFFQEWARNQLYADIFQVKHLGETNIDKHKIMWGIGANYEKFDDRISEWTRLDSAGFINNTYWDGGYTMPYNIYDTTLLLSYSLKSKNKFQNIKAHAYLQDSWKINDVLQMTYGIRSNYTNSNKEINVDPRLQINYDPFWKKDWLFRLAFGKYSQPPLYRELRNLKGKLNTDVKAQQSYHLVLGTDYEFNLWSSPFKITIEAYYKWLKNINPYEMDNVLIRYFADNVAKGYARGLDFRINGEFIPEAESWFSVSLLQTREDINNDYYNKYILSSGDTVSLKPNLLFNPVVDSFRVDVGFIPRPTHQWLNFAIFFQDYLAKNKNFKMSLILNFGSGLPFGPADGKKYNDIYFTPPYIRSDIGFSYLLFNKAKKESKPIVPLRWCKKIWLTAECFNVLDNSNTIAYTFVKDFANREYGIPQRLTSRRISARLLVDF